MIISLRIKIKAMFFLVIFLSSNQCSVQENFVNHYVSKVFDSLKNMSKKTAYLLVATAGVGFVFGVLWKKYSNEYLKEDKLPKEENKLPKEENKFLKQEDELLRKKEDELLRKKEDELLRKKEDELLRKKLEELIKKENDNNWLDLSANSSQSAELSKEDKNYYKKYSYYIGILRGKILFEFINEKIRKEIRSNIINYKNLSFEKINKSTFYLKNINVVFYIRILNEINKLLTNLIENKNIKIEKEESRLIEFEKNNNKYYKITNNPFPYYILNEKINSTKDISDEVQFFNQNFPLDMQMATVLPKLNECDYNPLISLLRDQVYWIFWCMLQSNKKDRKYQKILDFKFQELAEVNLMTDNLAEIKNKIETVENNFNTKMQNMNNQIGFIDLGDLLKTQELIE